MTERDIQLHELVDQNRVDLIIWDWKESVPVDDVGKAAQQGFVHMYQVDDTHGDFYAMIISKEPLQIEHDNDEVQQLFEMVEEKWGEADESDSHSMQVPVQNYRTLSLEIEILEEQDTEILTSTLTEAMSKLEGVGLAITDWRFVESPAYGKVEA